MSLLDQNLTLPKNLGDWCRMRAEAIERFQLHSDGIRQIEHDLDTFADHLMPHDAVPRCDVQEFAKDLDRAFWRKAFDVTNFLQVMDQQARSEFFKSVEENPPAFTEDNVRSTFLSLAAEVDTMFARGIFNVFSWLSKDHKTNTNEPFKINPKAILNYVVNLRYGGGLEVRTYYGNGGTLNDIDRVFKTLDNKKHVPRALEMAMNDAFKNWEVFEDEYFRAKAFRNGNLHIQFKRQDLLDQANRIIHDYCDGIALKHAPARAA
jgi:hypothetical protein